jgi:hypothetical protein
MEAYWGSCIASRPGRFTPRGRAPRTHWIEGWVGPRAVPDAVVKRKIPSPRRESNPRTPIVQLVAQSYTDWAITAPTLHKCSSFSVVSTNVFMHVYITIRKSFWTHCRRWRAGIAESVYWLSTGWTVGVRFPVGVGIFLFTNASRPALGPAQPPIQWVPGAVSLGGKAAGAWSWLLTSI